MAIEGVIAAAGLSSRMGVHKLLMDLGGETLMEKCLKAMYEHCERIIVVGGYQINAIERIMQKYSRVKVVFNPDYQQGMFSSIKEGCKHVRAERFFFTPADYPIIMESTYANLLLVNGDIIVPSYQSFTGHPVLMKSALIKEMLSENYISLRDFIISKSSKKLELNDPGVLIDVDTMEDYLKVKKLIESGAKKPYG
jgi:molybdenum cofactor cytidylyltransferase